MITRRLHAVAACLVLALALGACGGDDDGDDDAADPVPTTTSTTAAAAPAEPPATAIYPSLDEWFSDWNEINVTAATENDAAGITIDPAVFAFGPGPDGTEAFAGRISESVAMGGLRDPASGALMTLFQRGDPAGATTPAASLTTLTHLGNLDDLEPLVLAYREVSLNPADGTQRYIASGAHDFVIRGVGGSVVFFVHRVTDEATAVARADAVQAAVTALLGEG